MKLFFPTQIKLYSTVILFFVELFLIFYFMDFSPDTIGIKIIAPIAYVLFFGGWVVNFIADTFLSIADPTFFVLGGSGFLIIIIAQIIWSYILVCLVAYLSKMIRNYFAKSKK